MLTEQGLQRIEKAGYLRGFSNLFRKENRAWWKTRRWWINALLWPAALGSLVSIMLFVMPVMIASEITEEIIAAGGPLAYAIEIGISVFFRMGSLALAVGTIVLCQGLILDEKQTGVAEWVLSRPVTHRSYILAKLAASALAVLVLLVGLPSLLMYLLLSIRIEAAYDPVLFLKGAGLLAVHTLFYLTLTLMLGTFFSNRGAILGIGLASALGGTVIGGFIKPLLYITPWILGSSTELVVMGKPVTPDLVAYPLLSTIIWCVVFTILAFARFEKTEF
jgi:ABC-2 type transport system permease protein